MTKAKDVDLTYLISLEPEKAVDYLNQKGFKVTSDWREMLEDAHAKAFTVAKMTNVQLLKDTKETLQTAVKEGWSGQRTQRELKNMFQAKGWWGKKEITDPKTGDTKEIQLGSPRRVRTIYRQNIQSAYNAGRYLEQLEDVDFAPYLQYMAILDERTRPEHRALHEKTFKYDDPFWSSFYPPNGWGCRCFVRNLTDNQVEQKNITVEKSGKNLHTKDVVVNNDTGETKEVSVFDTTDITGKKISVQTDAGWSRNPGKAAWDIDAIAYDAVKDMPQGLKDKFISDMAQNIHKENAYKNFVSNIVANNLKAKGLEQTVTWLNPKTLNALQGENIAPKTPIVVMQDDRIGHIIGDVKIIQQRITTEQLQDLHSIINNPDEMFIDTEDKSIIFVKFISKSTIKDGRNWLKVIVKVDRTKGGAPVNYVATAGRVNKATITKNNRYKKIE